MPAPNPKPPAGLAAAPKLVVLKEGVEVAAPNAGAGCWPKAGAAAPKALGCCCGCGCCGGVGGGGRW